MNDYLIVVDVQNDFLPGGALPVLDGDKVIEPINRMIAKFRERVVYTRDIHPEDHTSFASTHNAKPFTVLPSGEMLWPDHCMRFTEGCQFPHDLSISRDSKVINKGEMHLWDSYSGFYIGGGQLSELKTILNAAQADSVTICGLATDYCVKATALDAIKFGFRTKVVVDACRGVDATPGDVERAYVEMVQAGIKLVGVEEINNPTGRQVLSEDARGGAE